MAGRLNVAVEPNARLHFHVVLPSSALRSRKDAVPDFPHQAGHHLATSSQNLDLDITGAGRGIKRDFQSAAFEIYLEPSKLLRGLIATR